MEFDYEKARAQDTALEDAGVTDDEVRKAIDGYLQAAQFAGTHNDKPLDGTDYAWSAEAQAQARDDVIAFILGNVSAIREFQRVTRHGWLQVGIDFNFTRNGEGAGFWDRGAGEVGVTLTTESKVYGAVDVYVNDAGEMEFT